MPGVRRATRHAFTVLSALSLLLSVAVCVLWVRGAGGRDLVEWKYNRWVADGGAAGDEIDLSSGNRIGVTIRRAYAAPRPARMRFTSRYEYYYITADQSGGRPRLSYRYRRYVPGWGGDAFNPEDYSSSVYAGWGPVRWYGESQGGPPAGSRARSIHVGISHWLVALLLLMAPTLWLIRFRAAHRARREGLCPRCGYDLRASPERCPECGTPAAVT